MRTQTGTAGLRCGYCCSGPVVTFAPCYKLAARMKALTVVMLFAVLVTANSCCLTITHTARLFVCFVMMFPWCGCMCRLSRAL